MHALIFKCTGILILKFDLGSNLFQIWMLLSTKRENAPTLNSTISDNMKDDSLTDYCSDFYPSKYKNLIPANRYNVQPKPPRLSQLKVKGLVEKLTVLQKLKKTITQKYDMCVDKLEAELESKEAQNGFIRDEIAGIRRDMKETRNDILLIKDYLRKVDSSKLNSKKNSFNEKSKERKPSKMHRLCKH